jgi:hypothetical protein
MSGGNPYRRRRRSRERQAEAEELELLAIEERFVAEHRAGQQPRLSAYVAAYPRHGQALAAFVAAYLDEEAGDAGGEPAAAQLSAGTQRALDLLFPLPQPEAGVREWQAGVQRVAESPEVYATGPDTGLLAEATARGMTAEALAEALDLTPALVRWLDVTAFTTEEAPAELVRRLARALGVSHEAALAALEAGGGPVELDGARAFRAALMADATLGEERRQRWLAALGEAG